MSGLLGSHTHNHSLRIHQDMYTCIYISSFQVVLNPVQVHQTHFQVDPQVHQIPTPCQVVHQILILCQEDLRILILYQGVHQIQTLCQEDLLKLILCLVVHQILILYQEDLLIQTLIHLKILID